VTRVENLIDRQLTGKHARAPSAYKHGGFSKTVLFPWEDADEFEALHRSRLRRATGIETAIFESVTAEPGKVEHGHSRPTLVEAAQLLHLVATRQSDAAAGKELSFDVKKDIADGFLRLAALPTFALDRLSRYEHLLWRQARQILFMLETLRRRKRQPVRSAFPISFRRREHGALSKESR